MTRMHRIEKNSPPKPAAREEFDLESGRYLQNVARSPASRHHREYVPRTRHVTGDEVADLKTHVGIPAPRIRKTHGAPQMDTEFSRSCAGSACPSRISTSTSTPPPSKNSPASTFPNGPVWLQNAESGNGPTHQLPHVARRPGRRIRHGHHRAMDRDDAGLHARSLRAALRRPHLPHVHRLPAVCAAMCLQGWIDHVRVHTEDTSRRSSNDVELVLVQQRRVQNDGPEDWALSPPDMVDHYGITGPNARGRRRIRRDLRKDRPYLDLRSAGFRSIVTGATLWAPTRMPTAGPDAGPPKCASRLI
jgi:hypothetical protein